MVITDTEDKEKGHFYYFHIFLMARKSIIIHVYFYLSKSVEQSQISKSDF